MEKNSITVLNFLMSKRTENNLTKTRNRVIIRSIISNTIEIAVVLAVVKYSLHWAFVLPVIFYNFYLSAGNLKQLVIVKLLTRATKLACSCITEAAGDKYPPELVSKLTDDTITGMFTEILGTTTDRGYVVTHLIHFATISVISYYINVIVGIAILVLHIFTLMLMENIGKDVVDIYSPIIEDTK